MCELSLITYKPLDNFINVNSKIYIHINESIFFYMYEYNDDNSQISLMEVNLNTGDNSKK